MSDQMGAAQPAKGSRGVWPPASEMRAEFWAAGPDVELPREVTAAGLGLSVASIEKKAIEGGGPPYRKFGRRCLYRKGDVIQWLDANSQRVQNTSQLNPAAAEAM